MHRGPSNCSVPSPLSLQFLPPTDILLTLTIRASCTPIFSRSIFVLSPSNECSLREQRFYSTWTIIYRILVNQTLTVRSFRSRTLCILSFFTSQQEKLNAIHFLARRFFLHTFFFFESLHLSVFEICFIPCTQTWQYICGSLEPRNDA